jgi:hypothetical protein
MPDVSVINRSEVQRKTIRALDASLSSAGEADVKNPEVLASSIRRAASFLCPCPPRTIQEKVERAFKGLVDDEEAVEKVQDALQQLILIGDLQDLSVEKNGRSRRMLYATPPSFVIRQGNQHVVLGVPSDGRTILSESYRDRMEKHGAVRFFLEEPGNARQILKSQGLSEVTSDKWLRPPTVTSPSDYIADFGEALDQAGIVSAEVAGVEILDPSESPRFYNGRWRKPRKKDGGRFVARRSQRYGADFWSYIEIEEGEVRRLVDLPLLPQSETPRDEAWRLQAAIDACRESPQVYRTRSDNGNTIVDVFSPLPGWAERQFRVVSESKPGEKGALRSYWFEGEASSEKQLLEKYLWMEEAADIY